MRLIDTLQGQRSITTIDDYVAALNSFQYQGHTYGLSGYGVQQTLKGSPVESVQHSFTGYASVQRSNGVIFACMLARQQVFAGVRFAYQRLRNGRPSGLFSTPDLAILSEPYLGGTTQDLLTRQIQDADLAGNGYLVKSEGELIRLRPDWVTLMLARNPQTGTLKKWAYLFDEDGPGTDKEPRIFWPENVSHFAPRPDPVASFRGMSWLTPAVRDTQTDNQMTDHKQKFLDNAATPNLAVTLDASIAPEKFERFRVMFEQEHRGSENAGKTLFLGGGADVTVVGKDLRQMEMTLTQSHGETRIAAAAGVPPIIVGLSEGLDSGTYSNYGQAVRRFGDGTMHELWQNFSGSLRTIVPTPSDAELWFDARDVPFLRQDALDAANIAQVEAQTIRSLIDAGYTPDTAVEAVTTGDWSRLVHTGLYSVQLQPAGTQTTAPTQEAT